MKRYIFVNNRLEGVHCYKNAPKEVSFLRNLHRHLFHVKTTIQVYHDDRDVEFLIFKKFIDKCLGRLKWDNNMSCEMISDSLKDMISMKYPKRELIIEVAEDGENGSVTRYDNTEVCSNNTTLSQFSGKKK